MKIFKNVIVSVFLSAMLFSSCKQVDENATIEYKANDIKHPSIEEIKNDLLDNELGIWTFSNLEEFTSVKIVNTSNLDSLNFEINLNLGLVDLETGTFCKGKIKMLYTRKDISINNWKFKEVTGDVYIDEEQNKSETNNSEGKVSESETEVNYSDQENEEESNDKERTLTCQYCGDKFTQKLVIISSYLGDIEVWEGGENHCDPNWGSKAGNNLAVNFSGISKYCSRKCACEAGED